MTWREFVNSNYNIYNVYESGDFIYINRASQCVTSTPFVYDKVSPTDVIISNHTYYTTSGEPE